MSVQVTDEMVDRAASAYEGNQSPPIGDSDYMAVYLAEQRIKIRAALTAALSVAPAPVAGDAEAVVAENATGAGEFEQVVDTLREAIREEAGGTWHGGDRSAVAFARVIALHRRAKQAGRDAALGELREWIETDSETIPELRRGPFATVAIAAMKRVKSQIDAMLEAPDVSK